jgi:broad specificity phosphatase PhoE
MDTLKRSDGWLDLPLSDKGRMGLIPAQQYLKLEPIKTIHSSPLKRTTETAHIMQSGILSGPDARQSADAGTWNLGALAGLPKTEARPKVKVLLENPDRRPLGGESHNEFRKRFMRWFDSKVKQAKSSGKPILIICSGSNLRLLGKELTGDRDAVNLDEGGLASLHHKGNAWHSERLIGDPAEEGEIS